MGFSKIEYIVKNGYVLTKTEQTVGNNDRLTVETAENKFKEFEANCEFSFTIVKSVLTDFLNQFNPRRCRLIIHSCNECTCLYVLDSNSVYKQAPRTEQIEILPSIQLGEKRDFEDIHLDMFSFLDEIETKHAMVIHISIINKKYAPIKITSGETETFNAETLILPLDKDWAKGDIR